MVVGAVLTALLGVLVLLPDELGLDRSLPFVAFAALRPTLTVLGALLVVVIVVVGPLRRRLGLAVGVPLLVTVVVAGATVVPRAVPDPPGPVAGSTELTVLSFNVYEGRADPAALADTVNRDRPDLVILPEAGERFRAAVAPTVPGYRSWTNVDPAQRDVRGIVVLASPRAGSVVAQPADHDTRYPWAELTGGILGRTRLVAVHVVSVVPRWIAYWPGELASMARWCSGPEPALVVGDFNATPDHSAFRTGTAGCRDAATERGASLTATWRSTLPRWAGAQIDHVLARGGPVARDVRVLDLPGSDHRALLVRMALPDR